MSEDFLASMRCEHALKNFINTHPASAQLVQRLKILADIPISVLLTGETGTGKGLCAEVIHQCSNRHKRPFIIINCGAGPDSLFDSQLFGHVKGAFSGADRDRPGLVEEAHSGVLFLDEINSLTPCSQVKLNFFLETGCFRRVGESIQRKVDIRIIAAANVDLREEIEKRRFRGDLYYRLAEYELSIPPLRERKDDIIPLAKHFLKKYAYLNSNEPIQFSAKALRALTKYHWPGNVRELDHFIKRCIVDAATRTIDRISLPGVEPAAPAFGDDAYLNSLPWKQAKKTVVTAFEKRYLQALLCQYRGIVARCARHARVHAPDFWQLMKKYDLHAENFR